MATRVFLSHSSRDKAVVRRLASDLQSAGVIVWLDELEIAVGDRITQKIQDGLRGSDFLAVWISRHAVESGWVEREWQSKYVEEVSSNRTVILPLLGDTCTVPELLRDKKYADFRDSYATGLEELLRVFQRKPLTPFATRQAEEVTTLADRFAGLSTKERNEGDLFANFVMPVQQQFEVVHNDYLNCFRKYRVALSNNAVLDMNHPIFDNIIEDHVFTAGTREKLFSMSRVISEDKNLFHMSADGKLISLLNRLIVKFVWYIEGDDIFTDDHHLLHNAPRSSLYSSLKFLASVPDTIILNIKEDFDGFCVILRGESECVFALTLESKAQSDFLQRAMQAATGDINKIRRALAISLIDSVIQSRQNQYGSATEIFENIKKICASM